MKMKVHRRGYMCLYHINNYRIINELSGKCGPSQHFDFYYSVQYILHVHQVKTTFLQRPPKKNMNGIYAEICSFI